MKFWQAKTKSKFLKSQPQSPPRRSRKSIRLSDLSPAARAQAEVQLKEQAAKSEAEEPAPYNKFKVSAAELRTCGDIVFSSQLEKRCYEILKQRLPAEQLHLQPVFELQEAFTDVGGRKHRAIKYVADFLLGAPRAGVADPIAPGSLVIDVKGMETVEWKIKRKLFANKYKAVLWVPKRLADLEEILSKFYESH